MSAIQQLLAVQKTAVSNTYATFNPSDKQANVSLSGGNLVAGFTSNSVRGTVRSTIGKSSGKWYWEYIITTASNDFVSGVGSNNRTTNYIVGQQQYGIGYYNVTGQKLVNVTGTEVDSSYGATYTSGDNIGVALNMDTGAVTFYKNGSSQGSISGLSGTIYAGISLRRSTQSITANFGASAFSYSVPSGYNSGLYT